VLPFTARQFGRAIVMPNLAPPIITVDQAKAYRKEILEALPEGNRFHPLMTCYLTDHLTPEVLRQGKEEGIFTAAKLYPAHATTNSAHGVTDLRHIFAVLETMEDIGLPLLIHGEATDPEIDIFDREAVFLERTLRPLLGTFPELRVVMPLPLSAITVQEDASPLPSPHITS
jgi:dihydroorotase